MRLVDTEDFIALVNDVVGERCDWFFEVYVRRPALPSLEHEVQDGALHMRWVVPGGLRFELPVPVELGGDLIRVEMPGGQAVVPLLGARFVIDPKKWLLINKPGR